MALVYLGLGSNLGNREEYLHKAISALEDVGISIKKQSKIHETDPVGGPVQGKFLNCVLEIRTDFTPEELLMQLQTIETQCDRMRTEIDGPRTLDIDILLYDQLKICTPNLVIPHPRMFERQFVMEPLTEVNPDILKEWGR